MSKYSDEIPIRLIN